MNVIIDVILVAILIASAVFAMKKGLIGTLFSLLGTVIAIVLSVMLSGPVSGFIDSNYVNPSVKQYILGVVDSSSVGKSYEEALNSIDVAAEIEKMPSQLKSVLELAGIDANDIISAANSATENSKSAKDNLINSIAAPISGTISRVIALIVLFIILNIALTIAVKLVTAVFNALPLGSTVNKAGGLIFGILRGLIIVFAISAVFSAVSKGVDPNSSNIFSKKNIDSAFVLKTVSDFNPINSVLNIK